MSRLSNRLPSKNALIWGSPLTTKSPRRSPSSRIHGTSSNFTKTWRLRHNTNNTYTRPPVQRHSISCYCTSPLRRTNDRLYLLTTNRLKIINCLLIRQPHRPCCRRNFNPNPMRLYRRPRINNCPRPSLVCPVLFGQYHLRTHPQPNNNLSPRNTNHLSTNSRLMVPL